MVPLMFNVDLHTHSNISDGVLEPAALAGRARANGLEVWALTDHDELSGIGEARRLAREHGMRHVPGVEISISWAGQTIHILGLQINENHPPLVQGLERTRTGARTTGQRNGGATGRRWHRGQLRGRAEICRQSGFDDPHPFRPLSD